MRKNLAVIVFLGLMFFCFTVNLFSQTPFSDDDKPVTPVKTTVGAPLTGAPEVIISGLQKVTDPLATATRSLWAELRKLYRESDKGRIGKRTLKKSRKVPTEHHLAKYDDLKINIDGDNYCGQFAMSTLLNGMGIKADPQDMYKKTNPAGIFTSPPIIVEHLRMSGIDARMKNQASVKDITKRIDEGKPVMVLVDSGGAPHWVCLTGYDTNAQGQVVSLRMRDSYWGTNGPHTMDIKDFEKAWKSPFGAGVLGDLLTYSNLLIDNNGPMTPTSPPLYPGTFSTATEDNMASGINDVVTGYKNRSYGQLAGGVAKLVLGLPGALTGVASNFLAKKSEGWTSWGNEKWKQDGIGNKLLGGAAIVGGGLVNGVAKTGKVIADVWSSGASVIGNGIKKLGSLFS